MSRSSFSRAAANFSAKGGQATDRQIVGGCLFAAVGGETASIIGGVISPANSGLPIRINAYTINSVPYDPAKRKKNRRKHEIDLAECDPIFDGPMLTREDDREEYGEKRLVSLGWLKGSVVVLVWTDREDGPE